MGKMSFFTPEQELIFNQVKKNEFLKTNFYFTGGTALSSFYLKHRYSEDMDFFSEEEFEQDKVLSLVQDWAKQCDFTFQSQFKEVVYIFDLIFKNNQRLKIDFGHYPYKRIEKGETHEGVKIDSLLDIAVNKLASVNQRSKVKDFVDLYFLLEKFTVWDLMEGVRVKFRMELEPWILAADLEYMVNQFTFLPRMIKPLTLLKLKHFFRQKAIELGKRVVE